MFLLLFLHVKMIRSFSKCAPDDLYVKPVEHKTETIHKACHPSEI